MIDLVKRICAIAARTYQTGHRFGPLLLLDGPNGSAVLRHDPAGLSGDAPTRDRARLMALALRADRCVVAVESTLGFSGSVVLPVLVVLTKGREGCHVFLFAPRRIAGQVRLSPVTTQMAGSVPAEVLDRLVHDVLPKSTQSAEVDQAWVCLEEMGVTMARDTRQLH
jgi:hypothetical protein